jgi:hypothetical protein
MDFSDNDRERFWNKVDIKGETDCWNWNLKPHKSGYPRFKIVPKTFKLPLTSNPQW